MNAVCYSSLLVTANMSHRELGVTEGKGEAGCESKNSRQEHGRQEAGYQKGVGEEGHPCEKGGEEISHVEGHQGQKSGKW